MTNTGIQERYQKYLARGYDRQNAYRLAMEEEMNSRECKTCGDGFNHVEENK